MYFIIKYVHNVICLYFNIYEFVDFFLLFLYFNYLYFEDFVFSQTPTQTALSLVDDDFPRESLKCSIALKNLQAVHY